MKHLDINYNEGFVYTVCGHQPHVIMDATSLAFGKELDSGEKLLNTPVKAEQRSGR